MAAQVKMCISIHRRLAACDPANTKLIAMLTKMKKSILAVRGVYDEMLTEHPEILVGMETLSMTDDRRGGGKMPRQRKKHRFAAPFTDTCIVLV